jgi:hypothetical protein
MKREGSKECYLEYEYSDKMLKVDRGRWPHLVTEYGDWVPIPKTLKVRRYLYLAFVYVTEHRREKGEISKLLKTFFKTHRRNHIYLELVKSPGICNGLVLRRFLERHRFKTVLSRRNERDMLRLAR